MVPITVRQLEAVVRIAESFARMQLQPVATEAHVRRALDLFTVSTMDAVKSGVMETVVWLFQENDDITKLPTYMGRMWATNDSM